MKLIYDKQKALEKKEFIDKAVCKENRRRKAANEQSVIAGVFVGILALATIVGVVLLILSSKFGSNHKELVIWFGIVAAILGEYGLAYVIYRSMLPRKFPNYPADVRFLQATGDYFVVEIRALRSGDYHAIFVDIENKYGRIVTVRIGYLKTVEDSNISEPVLDLIKEKYYIPPVKEEIKREDD